MPSLAVILVSEIKRRYQELVDHPIDGVKNIEITIYYRFVGVVRL